MIEPEKPDRIDAEEILNLLKSPAWTLIAGRIDAEVVRQNADLVEARHTEAEMNEIRGMILGLRKALEIPRIIATEGGITGRKVNGTTRKRNN